MPYNGSFETLLYVTMSGRFQQRCFRYIAGLSDERLLKIEKIGSIKAAVQFSDIDHNIALRQISTRAVRESKHAYQVPSKKVLIVRSLTTDKPDQDYIDSFEMQNLL